MFRRARSRTTAPPPRPFDLRPQTRNPDQRHPTTATKRVRRTRDSKHLGNNVFFANGKRVAVSETMESEGSAIHGPFTVRLGWKEAELTSSSSPRTCPHSSVRSLSRAPGPTYLRRIDLVLPECIISGAILLSRRGKSGQNPGIRIGLEPGAGTTDRRTTGLTLTLRDHEAHRRSVSRNEGQGHRPRDQGTTRGRTQETDADAQGKLGK